MNKTGSSSIQNTLANVIFSQKWDYLRLTRSPNQSVPFACMFLSNPYDYHVFKKRGLSLNEITAKRSAWRDKLTSILDNTRHKNILISGESICNIDHEGVTDLANFLKPHFDNLQIAAYVRPPAGFQASAFQQRIKGGQVTGVGHILAKPRYRERFEKFDKVFGRENVALWKYSPELYDNCCVVADFCKRLGFHISESAIRRKNDSLSREAVGILYAYRKCGMGYGGTCQPLSNTFTDVSI